MRTLKFIVDKQIIKKDPECDFDNIVPGSSGYLRVDFSFSSEWTNAIKVASFWKNGKECEPRQLVDGHSCIIPDEALTSRRFKIGLLGKDGEMRLNTNLIEIIQNGG